MKLERILSVPIFSVVFMVGFVYYVTVFIFIEDCSGLSTSEGSRHAMVFTLLAFLFVFSFFVCVLTDPGGVPPGFVPDVEHSLPSDQEDKTSHVNPRQCDKCSAYKPPRAHHCRVCRRCVLRMDHHCVWINNCVGHRNYKAFVVSVFYATIATTYSWILFLNCVLQKDQDFSGRMPLKIFYIACGVMFLGLTSTLGTLLAWHIYLISHNKTTIEYYDGKRAAWLAKKSGLRPHHPFDVGAFKNFTLVLGPNMLKWLWPTAVSHIKDGLSFPTARDNL
ncbi:probable protein S-acyltransferase 15 [Coffea eugenioides]|uniref:probable protein S-acyltransferase 15 n=1 Tax=Coffea eugenioides TaxID=49369 RepID=UPI000F61579B|nr:probable protein S-acyltransferase 15 [Coffea eugenioides]